jgi:hypothetical protein
MILADRMMAVAARVGKRYFATLRKSLYWAISPYLPFVMY